MKINSKLAKRIVSVVSMALVFFMVLSGVPGATMTVHADVGLVSADHKGILVINTSAKTLHGIGVIDEASVVFVAGATNSEWTRAIVSGYDVKGDYSKGYWYQGISSDATTEFNWSNYTAILMGVSTIAMEGGNIKTIYIKEHMSDGSVATGNGNFTISGGKVGIVYGFAPTSSYSTGNITRSRNGNIDITVTNAEIGQIYGVGCCVRDYTATGVLSGDVNIDISNATVGSVYLTDFANGAVLKGNAYVRVLDSTVGNIYVDPNSTGVISGHINSGKLNSTDGFTNLLYLDGSNWVIKGDLDTATKNADITIEAGQTMTLSEGNICNTTITNYGTLVVKNGAFVEEIINCGTLVVDNGGIVNKITNSGTLQLKDGSNVATVDNQKGAKATVTGVWNVGTFTNNGTLDFTGRAGDSSDKIITYGLFRCHGDHDGITIQNESSLVICDSIDCSDVIYGGQHYTPQAIEWDLYDIEAVNKSSEYVCYSQDFTCTLQTTSSGFHLPKTITVEKKLNIKETLVQGKDYSYDPYTGAFKLFGGTVGAVPIRIYAVRSNIINLSSGTVVELEETKYLYDGTAKTPKITNIYHKDQYGTIKYLEEGVDYEISYKNNVNPGTGSVVIKGLEWFSGTYYANFEIYQKDISAKGDTFCSVEVEEGTYTYTGQEHKPKVTKVTYNTRYTDENGNTAVDTVELTEGVDYTVSYENNINAGYESASVIVTGMGQYTGTITKIFSIEEAWLKDCTITGTKVPYTGEKQTYDITLTYNGMVLEKSYNSGGTTVFKDYGIVPQDSRDGLLNAGDKQLLRIQSTGDNFQGEVEVYWEIVPYDISNETVYVVENYDEEMIVFTGKEQDLSDRWAIYLTIWIDGVLQSVHGTLTTPVTNVDDSSTFVAASRNYSGSLDVTGFMEPADISKAAVSMKDLTYNGEEQSMSITSYLADYDLEEGRDYTISGTTKATEPGTYTITMTGKGNFSGTRKESWEIKPVDISQVTLEMEEPARITYDGEPHTLDTVVKYTYPNGNTVEIPGTWSACTDIDDVAVFTADSDYFTGTYKLGVIIEPLDITKLVVFPESGAYNGHKHVPIAVVEGFTDFTDYTYELTYDKEPIDVGTYTAYIKGKGNFTGTAERTYKVTPAELSVKVTLENKTYDGTKDVEIKNATLQDVLTGDDVTLDYSNLQIILSSADAGTYPTATATGLTLSGSDVTNYTYNLETVTLRDTYNDVFYIRKAEVHIVAEEQDINETEELDQTQWHVHETFPVPEGFTLTGITLAVDEEDNSVIVPSGGKITKNDTSEDVTENFEFTYYNSNLSVVCINHDTSDNGFCPNCDVYEPATRNDNGTPDEEWDDYYEIANGGQLYWYAEQVNKYGLSNTGAVLVKDIVVNRDMTAGNLREWTPIGSSGAYCARFDGQGHIISGLYCVSENNYVGLFGQTGYNYSISNIGITNSYFEGKDYVGALAGFAESIITNCYADDSVTVECDNYYYGGLVGYNYSAISNSYAMASTFVGSNSKSYGATIENCYYLADEDSDGYNGTTAKSTDAFASGEVAYLLQSGQEEEGDYNENGDWVSFGIPEVWGQNIDNGSTTQSYPVLSDATVYKVNVYDCPGDTEAIIKYSNTDGDTRTTTHTDTNADEKCDICGEFVDGIGARLAGYTLSLDGNIGVNFYMELDEDVATDTSAYMLFTLPGDGTQTVLVSQATKNTTLTTGKTYYVFSCKVAAKEMTDTIKAQMICSNGTKAGTKYTYSVREYALALITREGETSKAGQLAIAMLNYGAYAQTYFNYKTDTLANVGYEDNALTISADAKKALKDYVPEVNVTEVNVTEGSALTYAGSTIRLESELKVRHYFKLAEGATEPSELTLYVPPTEYAEEITDTYYYYESDGIAFGSWGTKTTYSEVAGNTITYCPLSYVTTVVATKADSDLSGETSLQNLMKALYLYYQSVVSYNAK